MARLPFVPNYLLDYPGRYRGTPREPWERVVVTNIATELAERVGLGALLGHSAIYVQSRTLPLWAYRVVQVAAQCTNLEPLGRAGVTPADRVAIGALTAIVSGLLSRGADEQESPEVRVVYTLLQMGDPDALFVWAGGEMPEVRAAADALDWEHGPFSRPRVPAPRRRRQPVP